MDGADSTEMTQLEPPTLSMRRLISQKFGSTSDFQGCDSFHSEENSLLPVLRVYSSALASKMSLLTTAKRSEMLQRLVTHVPDLVVNRLMDSKMEPPTLEKNYGVLVFADVSGFTALTEKFCHDNKNRKKGTDQLTSILNNYLTRIVHSILNAGGDILKFAGDALLAFWRCDKRDQQQAVTNVMENGLSIQDNYDNFKAGEGINLRVKIAISVGDIFIYHLGNKSSRIFLLGGDALEDANVGQSLTGSGTVVVSSAVWEACSRDKFFANFIGDSKFVEVIQADDILGEEMADIPGALINDFKKSRASVITLKGDMLKKAIEKKKDKRLSSVQEDVEIPQTSCESLELRSLALRGYLKVMSGADEVALRSYIQAAVLHKIDHGHEVAWLSELRMVSVVFINLELGIKNEGEKKLSVLQNVFEAIYMSVVKFEGSLNKVFAFDKGCTFLCVFGLAQAMHEARALRASKEMFHTLDTLNLKRYSIGVTTGVAFCGVVGHPQRHEYTVISQKVNMAARLMLKFPDAVTCDETTKIKSKLPEEDFVEQPPVALKGIADPGSIFAYSTVKLDRLERHYQHVHLDIDVETLVGREEEMEIFMNEVVKVKENEPREHGVIILSAVDGMGKSKLMRAMKSKAAHMGFRIVSGVAGLIEQNTPFFAVKTLITRLLELDRCHNAHEREDLILKHVSKESGLSNMLPLLNDLLMVKFPQTNFTMSMTMEERNSNQHKLLYSIIHGEALAQPCVFGVDDAHWVDQYSWSFFLDLAKEDKAIVLLSMMPLVFSKDKKSRPKAMEELMQLPGSKVLHLKPLKPEKMVEIACILLGVDELPKPIEDIIRDKTHGIPLFAEELVESMLERNILNFHSVVKPGKLGKSSQGRKIQWLRKVSCTLNENVSLSDIPIPESINEMIQSRVDHLPATAQLTIKCAAVIGTTFTKSMLKGIIPKQFESTLDNSIRLLQTPGIIRCAVAEAYKMAIDDGNVDDFLDNQNLYCPCLEHIKHYKSATSMSGNRNILIDEQNLDHCETLQFSHPIFQETIYGLWTEKQCIQLHEKAALFLESQAHKCKSCGGGGFIAGGQNAQFMKKMSGPSSSGKGKMSGNIRAFMGLHGRKARERRRNKVAPSREQNELLPPTTPHRSRRQSTFSSQVQHRNSSFGSINWACGGRVSAMSRTGPGMSSVMSRNGTSSLTRQNSSNQSNSWNPLTSSIVDVDLQNCQCADVLAHVYPQLIIHWKAAGNMPKTVHYLIEAANAAIATNNDMEALALLDEAKEIIQKSKKKLLSEHEMAVFESSYGQALFQSGRVKESIHHFKEGLHILGTRMPTSKAGSALNLAYQAAKQYLHTKLPQVFHGRKKNMECNKRFQDRAHCMAHMTQAFHLQHKNMLALMAALQQLNAAEESGDVHELIEAYAVMIECCQLYNLESLGEYYIEKANQQSSDLSFCVDDLVTFAHLMSVMLNFKLCHGKIFEAGRAGHTAASIASKLHEPSLQLSTIPKHLWTQLMLLNYSTVQECLNDLNEVSKEADDLRATALFGCCEFDAFLEIGLQPKSMDDLTEMAKQCCAEDVYHFDDIERFFLVTCLATWYARIGKHDNAKEFMEIAKSLKPKKFETFLAVKGFGRYVECCLLLWNTDPKNKKHKKEVTKVLYQFKKVTKHFPVLKPRVKHLQAYSMMIKNKFATAKQMLNEAINAARMMHNNFDSLWAEYNKLCWFSPNDQLLERMICSMGNFCCLPIHTKPNL